MRARTQARVRGRSSHRFIRGELLESRDMLAAVTEDLLGPDAILEDLFPSTPPDEGGIGDPIQGDTLPIPAIPYDESIPTSGDCPGLPPELCLPGDLNDDRTVDLEDFLRLSHNFGLEDAGWQDGDLNGDGLVSFADFMILSEHFGKTV